MLFLLRVLLLCEGLCYIKGDDKITLEKKKGRGKERERERKQQGLAVVER